MARFAARDTSNKKINLVAGLLKEPWEAEYESAGLDIYTRDLSHVDHAHTGKRLLGLGVEMKAPDRNAIEAQVQLAVWMAGLVSWGFSSRRFSAGPLKLPPPIIGYTVVGKTWEKSSSIMALLGLLVSCQK